MNVDASPRVPARKKGIRLAVLLVPAAIFLGLLGAVTLERTNLPEPGGRAPDFIAPLLSGGGSLGLEELRGRPVMLNFWASWCAPCKDEAPLLRRASHAYGDRVAFVGVVVKDARSEAIAFANRNGLSYPHVRDENGTIYADYGLTGQPETFFIDADGTIVEHVNGPLSAQALAQLLDVLVSRDA